MNLVRWCAAAVAVAVTIAWSGGASAQAFAVTITVDEDCRGTFSTTAGFFEALPCELAADPGPGGLPGAVTYGLLEPPGLTAGDLIILEPEGQISDVVRFNPQGTGGTPGIAEFDQIVGGTLVFYSDNSDGADALADIGFPTALYANVLTVTEVGPEGNNGFIYTPTAGQPGFVTEVNGTVTYIIQSDSVPEPATLALLGIGLAGVAVSLRKRKH